MIVSPPAWALALTYWLHLLATVTWVGSLAGVSLLILPAMKRSLDSANQLYMVVGTPGGPRIIAVSQDMAPRASVEAFLDTHKIGDVESWHDPKMALSSALDARLLPTTIYYDAGGREVWRYVGDLDWSGEEAAKLLADGGPAKKG